MSKAEKKVLLIFSTIIYIYLILRAWYVPLVHDEVASFFHYVQSNSFIPFLAHWDANNHILNSALTSLFFNVFGESAIVLRLANLLFFPVFVYYIYRLSEGISDRYIRWFFIISMLLSHNFIEFFATSRAYGMSMALILGAVFHLMKYLNTLVTKERHLYNHFIFCLVFCLLSLTANLTLLFTVLIIFLLIVLNTRFNAKTFASFLFIGIVPICFFVYYLTELKKRELLYYGGLDGFWEITVKSLSKLLTGYTYTFIPYFFLFVFLIISFFAFYAYRKRINFKLIFEPNLVFYFLLIGNILAVILSKVLMKVNYPEDRTGLYLFPFLLGAFCLLADKVISITNRKLVLLCFLPFLFLPIHFITHINLSYIANWKDEALPERFFNIINKEKNKDVYPNTIGGYHMRGFCWTYLNYKNAGNLGIILCWHYPDLNEDFQIVHLEDYSPLWKDYYQQIDYDKYSELSLLKRKKFLEKKLALSKDTSSSPGFTGDYFNISSFPATLFVNKSIYVGYKLTINSQEKPFDAWIVIEVRDKNDKSIDYEIICLKWLKYNYSGEKNNFINGFLIPDVPKEADHILTYLWNINKKSYSVSGNCSVYNLE